MQPFRRTPQPSLALTTALDSGVRRSIPLDQNSYTHIVWIMIRLTLTISVGAATSVINKGSAAACFDLIGINENGFDRVAMDPRVAAYLAQVRALSTLSNVRLAAVAVAAYNLVEMVPIFLTNPNSLNPGETAFREKNPVALTALFVQLANNAATKLVIQGGATLALTNINVTVMQQHNPNQKQLPWFQPFISQQVIPVVGVNAHLRIPLMTDRYLAGVVLSQEATNGEVSDVISAVSLLSDVRTYIGNQQVSWEDMQRYQEEMFGGAVLAPSALGVATAGAHLFFDFMNHGQLSTIIDPNETNLRFDLAVAQSAAGGAAGSQIRVTTLECIRDLQVYQGPDGQPRRLCNPNTPPWLAAGALRS